MLSSSETKLYWMKVFESEDKRILLLELTPSARCGELASMVSFPGLRAHGISGQTHQVSGHVGANGRIPPS